MKIFLVALLFLHGVIHLMGYLGSIGVKTSPTLPLAISKVPGYFWLSVALVFVITSVLLIANMQFWTWLTIVGITISQVLIIMQWKEAKAGTLVNVILLVTALIAIANHQWQNKVEKEVVSLCGAPAGQGIVLNDTSIASLPEPVKKWIISSGAMNIKPIQFVQLKQKGELKTSPGGKWMPFTATQYFNAIDPAFIWSADVQFMPMIHMYGRDKLIEGKGQMQIKLLSLIDVVKEGDNEKMNTGTMIRYLAETIWFPTAAISPFIRWEEIDSTSARAVMNHKGTTASAIFYFQANGDVKRIEADRYFGGGEDAKKEKWVVDVTGVKVMNGVRIAFKNSVTWALKEGDFNWANMEITDIEYVEAGAKKVVGSKL
jgi:hypothetical protein